MININDIDKQNKYSLSELEKTFISYYIEFKNLVLISNMLHLDQDQVLAIYKSYGVQEEIKNINNELIREKFKVKMLNLNDIGSYLTTLITNENVPLSEQLNKKEKLDAVKLLIQIHGLIDKGLNNPAELVNYQEVDKDELKQLPINTIKDLIKIRETSLEKEKLINEIDKNNTMSIEDKALLKSLSVEELVNLLKKGEKNVK